jgi:hypothetical protein
MTRFLEPSFSSPANSDAYRENWDEVFAPKWDLFNTTATEYDDSPTGYILWSVYTRASGCLDTLAFRATATLPGSPGELAGSRAYFSSYEEARDWMRTWKPVY